ncbi:MAG: hypothetical protein JKX76_00990 [Colwellia sp.]|nr:hypothetical protein [Colwellia sp.]
MGASTSNNISTETISAITNVSTSIINDTSADTLQQQAIIVNCVSSDETPCDVIISGITQSATATIDMTAIMTSMNSSSVQQDLISELTQVATSVTSGINFAQYSDANNEMYEYLSAAIDITTNVSQECSSSIDQEQTINVNIIDGGNVSITDVTQSEFSDIWDDCLLNSINDSTAVQDLQNTVDQSSTAKSEGLSMWMIIVLVIAAMLMLVVPITITGNEMMSTMTKIFFPLIFIMGLTFLILYYTEQGTSVAMYSLSKGFKEKSGCATSDSYTTSTDYDTPTDAASFIKNDPNKQYVAFDWQGWDVGTDGGLTQIDTPITTLYTKLENNDCTPSTDDTKLYESPSFTSTDVCPTDAQAGDICISTTDGHTYTFIEGVGWSIANDDWVSSDEVMNGAVIIFDIASPSDTDTADYWFVVSNPSQVALWTNDSDGWSSDTTLTAADSAPGYRVTMPIYYLPNGDTVDGVTNTSGKLFTTKNSWMLTVGIICMVTGMLGSAMSFFGNNGKNKESKEMGIRSESHTDS